MIRACPLVAAALLAGCQFTPTNPNMTMTVAGKYRAVAECTYLALLDRSNLWKMDDLSSLKKVRLTNIIDGNTVGNIEFSPAGAGTRVEMRMSDGIFTGFSESFVRPRVTRCAGRA